MRLIALFAITTIIAFSNVQAGVTPSVTKGTLTYDEIGGRPVPIPTAVQQQCVNAKIAAGYTPLRSQSDLSQLGTPGNYVLAANIALNNTFTPISTFLGNFDGCGLTIYDLDLTGPGTSQKGFFLSIARPSNVSSLNFVDVRIANIISFGGALAANSAANISNVQVIGGSISGTGSARVGGLVGQQEGGTEISRSSSSAVITNIWSSGAMNFTGGLVGVCYGNISRSNSTGSVTGTHRVGGLVGTFGKHPNYLIPSISSSYSTGNVVVNSNSPFSSGMLAIAGGLVGDLYGDVNTSYSTSNLSTTMPSTNRIFAGGFVGSTDASSAPMQITNSFATGNVSGNYFSAGFVGNIAYLVRITNSYSTGSSTGQVSGGFAAYNNSGNAPSFTAGTYWNASTSGQAASTAGSSLTEAQMHQQASFANWDFTSIWNPPTSSSYPTLRTSN